MNAINETELPPDVRRGIEQLRAANNVESVTVQSVHPWGAYVVLVPTGAVAEGGGWGMPTEPTLVLIPSKVN